MTTEIFWFYDEIPHPCSLSLSETRLYPVGFVLVIKKLKRKEKINLDHVTWGLMQMEMRKDGFLTYSMNLPCVKR